MKSKIENNYYQLYKQLLPQIELARKLQSEFNLRQRLKTNIEISQQLQPQFELIKKLQSQFTLVHQLQELQKTFKECNQAIQTSFRIQKDFKENIEEIYKNSIFSNIWYNTDRTISEDDIIEFKENIDSLKVKDNNSLDSEISTIVENIKQYPEFNPVVDEAIQDFINFLAVSSLSEDDTISKTAKAIFNSLKELPNNKIIGVIVWYLSFFSTIITIVSFIKEK